MLIGPRCRPPGPRCRPPGPLCRRPRSVVPPGPPAQLTDMDRIYSSNQCGANKRQTRDKQET
ncbi:hypothetical protein EYF80_052167 [Liparis tanakae]|uniref:Uncharacterized protein n=1 Tax=Liparis tanakae TaxID=230148 RepID=A0A4Z2F9M4_9TELE|nr:hypothetical protein EYF80_052167 [Liparis tanakae]